MAAGPASPTTWGGLSRLAAIVAAALLAAYLALAYLVDPYDTGRSPFAGAPDIRPQGPRTAAASRGRDPAFNAAIVGNSHSQLLSPERLNALTGLRFVQLSVPATGPGEQLELASWFLRHHPQARALVVMADPYWCRDDPLLAASMPFPHWLYVREPWRYLAGLVRLSAAQEIAERLRHVLTRDPDRARPDGYWDYGPDYLRQDPEARRQSLERRPPRAPDPGRAGPFPAAARLKATLAAVPPSTAVLLYVPPVYVMGLPEPGSPREAAETACKAALTEALRVHPRRAIVDWRLRRPEIADPSAFLDQSHYGHDVARAVERSLASALKGLP